MNLARKKPGRGEQSNKATCADKILKWTLTGLQGRRLYPLTRQSIRLHSIVIGSCETAVDGGDDEIHVLRQSLSLGDEEEEPPSKRRRSFDLSDGEHFANCCPKLERDSDFKVNAFIRSDQKRACPKAIAHYRLYDGRWWWTNNYVGHLVFLNN